MAVATRQVTATGDMRALHELAYRDAASRDLVAVRRRRAGSAWAQLELRAPTFRSGRSSRCSSRSLLRANQPCSRLNDTTGAG